MADIPNLQTAPKCRIMHVNIGEEYKQQTTSS